MKALVIYESIFGNTKEIAHAVAKGLQDEFEVEVAEVSEPHSEPEQADLFVIGGPTHVLSMSKDATRADGRKKSEKEGLEPISMGDGIRELLERLPEGRHRPLVATYDTSIKKWWLPVGSAAKSASKGLKKKGFEAVINAEQFKVAGMKGPTEPGEIERAEQWGRELANRASAQVAASRTVEVG